MRPFCANERCFMHAMEVPDDHQATEVGLPTGASRTYYRSWLVAKRDGRKYPLCDSCGNIIRVIMGDGEGLAPSTGVQISGELIAPDGSVVATAKSDKPFDITEPEIKH